MLKRITLTDHDGQTFVFESPPVGLVADQFGEPEQTTIPDSEEPFRLCYVFDGWAWFTTCPLDKQWGDDWNDAPYEHNAETPYHWSIRDWEVRDTPRYRLLKIQYLHPHLQTPDQYMNQWVSVQDINQSIQYGKSFSSIEYPTERSHRDPANLPTIALPWLREDPDYVNHTDRPEGTILRALYPGATLDEFITFLVSVKGIIHAAEYVDYFKYGFVDEAATADQFRS